MTLNESLEVASVNTYFISATEYKGNWYLASKRGIYKYPANKNPMLSNQKTKAILLKRDWSVFDATGKDPKQFIDIGNLPKVSPCDYCAGDTSGFCALEEGCYEIASTGCFQKKEDK